MRISSSQSVAVLIRGTSQCFIHSRRVWYQIEFYGRREGSASLVHAKLKNANSNFDSDLNTLVREIKKSDHNLSCCM